jgi:nucleotide-binding universal stress UspA family protein
MIRITHVLCPVDLSETSRHALEHAAAIARWYHARLTLLFVYANLPTMDLPPLVLTEADRAQLLADLRGFAAGVPPDVATDVRVEEGEYVHETILAQLAATHADLLVIGTHGRSGFQKLFLGSVTEKVIRKAGCPTLVVPPRAGDRAAAVPAQVPRMLCAVDFSESSLQALAFAISLAGEADARLTLLHVVEMPLFSHDETFGAAPDLARVREAALADAARRLHDLVPASARHYCTVETAFVEGRAYREILARAAAAQADLIVMGVHGRGAVDRLVFGSTTHHVIRAAACPVLVVRRE